ncbi:hypothetical protein [Streptomyces sp. NBC_01497]|uniref:hypothetical protein n=1 Tax=Streptomyces sp. NBC_01497 TaxID=2903885 RepID=UPI002E2F1E01|nr:hypothetical protein [Streptomyces sp. NBC_01497]
MPQSAISWIWRAFALAPRRWQTFKWPADLFFIDKVRDVGASALDLLEKALLPGVDGKFQIQALDRS